MVYQKRGIARQLKEKVNPFLLSCHCVGAKKSLCVEISKEVEKVINGTTLFFKNH